VVKTISGFFVAILVLAGCAGGNRDLVSLGKQADAFVNAHNIDGFAGLLADDVVLKGPDGSMHRGKDSAKAWMASMQSGFHVDSRGYQQSGDTLSWVSTVRSESFASMGINPIRTNTMAVYAGDKIRYFEADLDQESAGKMRFLQFYGEVVNGGNIDAIDNYITEDMIEHQPLPPGTPKGAAGVKAYFKMIREAYPDLHGTPTMILADGDKVLIYATWEGTNKGKFMGKPASNKKVSWGVGDIIRLVNGKAVEHWGWGDAPVAVAETSGK
jgi:predicted ester cyclase